MEFDWNEEKNKILKQERKLSFEQVKIEYDAGRVLGDAPNPTRPNQRVFIVRIDGYVCLAPYVVNEFGIFLKTVFRSRAYNAVYGGKDGKT